MSRVPAFDARCLALVGALASGSLACSANVGDDGNTSAQQVAIVEVRAHESIADARTQKLDVTARVAAIRDPGTVADAIEVLGLRWSAPPVGTCAAVAPESAGTQPAHIELRDLAPVRVDVSSATGERVALPMEARAFPDVMGIVSGVVYATPAATQAPLAGSVSSVELTLGASLSGALELPSLPAQLKIDAAESEGAYAVDANGFDLWATAKNDRDALSIEISRGGVARARCGLDGQGHLRIDGASLGGAGELSLTVRAQRNERRLDAALGTLDVRLERVMDLRVLAR
jgi:hypothetical protein